MSTTRPAAAQIEHISINYSGLVNSNHLQYNSAVGVFAAEGATGELQAFLSAMKPHHINSFLGGTCYVTRLETPLIVYRTGDLGKFWSLTPPTSPIQQALDLAMPFSVYPELPSIHPANKGVLMYQIPAGKIIAAGNCAPQGGFPGQSAQVYLPHVEADRVMSATWSEWITHHRSPLAFTSNWQECQVSQFRFKFENVRAQNVMQNVMPRLFGNPSSTFQTVLQLAEKKSLQGALQVYAYDLAAVENNAAGVTYYYSDGTRKILLQTQDAMGLYREASHEFTHGTLPLASNSYASDPLYGKYAPRIRQAVCTDFWEYKRMGNVAPIQQRVADWMFAKPYSYPIAERLPETMAFTVQGMVESEMAAKSVAPRTIKVVQEYVAEYAASNKPVITNMGQPVKIWDAKHAVTSSYKPTAAMPAFDYRTLSRTIGQFGVAAIAPPLMALDFSNRLEIDRAQFPGYSQEAHYAAVITDMGVDTAIFTRGMVTWRPGLFMPIMMYIDFNANLANAIRHVPLESMMNNRDFLEENIRICEFSPAIEKMLLDDFDNGGSKSRNFNLAAADAMKIGYKPFQWYYDIKKAASNFVRDLVHNVPASHFMMMDDFGHPTQTLQRARAKEPIVKASRPFAMSKLDMHEYHRELPPLLPQYIMKDQSQDAEPEIIEIAEGVEDCARQASNTWPAFFNEFDASVPSSGSAMGFTNQQVRLMDCNNGQMTMHVGMGNAVMTPEFHQFLNNLNTAVTSDTTPVVKVEVPVDVPEVKVEQNQYYGTQENADDKKDDKPAVPLISNVGIGKVGDRLGVIATIAGIAQVGVAADKAGGFLVMVSAEFGPQFWSAMGAGIGVGAAVAAALLVANIFISRHQKHVASKINSGVKHSNKDGEKINNCLQNLFNDLHGDDATRNLEALIKQTESLIAHVKTRIDKEEERGDYARSHGQNKAKKAHRDTEKAYKGIVFELSTLRQSLQQEQVQLDFIKQHAAASSEELVGLAKGLIVKFSSTNDAKNASDKDSQHRDPYARLQELHNQGYRLYVHIKDSKGKGHTKGHHLTLAEANQHMLNGGTVEAKKSGNKEWIGEAKTTYSKTELSSISALRSLIVNKVLELVQEGRVEDAKDLLKNPQELCLLGTSAADLKLSGLSTLLDRLTLAGQSTPAFWLGELERVRTGAVVMNEDEKLLLKSRASEQLLGHVISNAVIGNFETSKSIIEGMKIELSDLNAISDKISAKLDALKPIIGDVNQCIATMKANTQDQSRTKQLDNIIEDAALAFAVKKEIFAHAAENRLDKAEERAAEFAEASPDNAETAKSYAAGIAKIKHLHEKPNKELLSALEENAKAKTDSVSGENEIVSSTLTTWIYDGIFKSVLSGDTDSAVRDLNELVKQDKSQAALCQRLTQTISVNADVAKRSEAVLLDEYSALLEKQESAKRTEESEKVVENLDPHAGSALAMQKTMVLGALLGNAFDKGRRGYNREAAESLAELRRRDASLKLSTQEEDFRFSHHEQLIGVCIKPVQDVAMRFVRGYKPSAGRSIALGALELTTAVQIIAPTSLSLALQFAHAKYTLRDVAPAMRNGELVLKQLLKDIWPFAKGYNPLNPENYYNGAMIYTQLALKGVEHLPLKYIVSPKYLHRLEGVRGSVLNYGHKSIRAFSTVTAAMQLRTAYYSANGLANLANVPMLACTVANAVFDAGCWLDYQSKAKQGKAPEYPEYYQVQEGVRSAFDTASTFAFVAWITGGIGVMAWAIGAAKLTQSAYVVTCESTRIDINTKAMMAACSNVGYFRNLQYELQRAASADTDSKVTVPVMYEYTSSVIYLILKDKPTNGILDAITDGSRIVFTEEEAHYYLYFRNDLNLVETISLAQRPVIFDQLQDKSSCAIGRDSEHYQKISEFASACIVSHHIANSAISIEKRLAVFGGLAYVSDDKEQEAANVARITYLKQKVKNDYDAANHDAVLEATQQVTHKDKVLINSFILIPPHVAWDLILFYRLTTFIQSPKLLMKFRDEYEACSKLIYESAKTDPAWYQAHKDEIKKSMEQIVCYARQQMIDAAQRAETKKEKLAYLALIMQSYRFCKDWDIMLDDDFKFAAAAIYSKLDDHDKTTLFMERIRDLTGLLCKKNNGALTADALTVLDQVQSTQYNDILFRAARGELPVDDEQLLVNALNLIEKKKYDNAAEMLETSREFLGKGVALAKLIFASSNLMSLQQSLQLLSKEKSRSLHYWILLESIIQRFYESTKYFPDAMKQLQIGAKLCGWRKVCLDYIYKFDLDEKSRANVDRIQTVLTHQVRYYLAEIHQKTPKTSIQDAQRQYREFIDAGHQAMRGENNMNIFDELQSMMRACSYTYVENNERHRYLPLEVPPDGDCGLHVFGISRKDAINLLMQHVQAQEWSADLSNTPNVYTILLNDLEFTNNAIYGRSELSFNANKKMVIAYLNLLSQPKYWLPHNQASESVLDALAFALGNNLRVFVSDSQGKLQLSAMSINNNEFPIIDVLYTSADGFSADGSGLNHYIRLQKLSSNVVELVTEQSAAQRPPQWSQAGLFRRKISTTTAVAATVRNNL